MIRYDVLRQVFVLSDGYEISVRNAGIVNDARIMPYDQVEEFDRAWRRSMHDRWTHERRAWHQPARRTRQ